MYIVTEKPLPPALRRSECPVCYEELSSSDETIPIVLNCNHIFCITCIRQISNQRTRKVTCPLCRRSTRMRTIDLIKNSNLIPPSSTTNIDDTTTTCLKPTNLDYLCYILFLVSFWVLLYVILPAELKNPSNSHLENFLCGTLTIGYDILFVVSSVCPMIRLTLYRIYTILIYILSQFIPLLKIIQEL